MWNYRTNVFILCLISTLAVRLLVSDSSQFRTTTTSSSREDEGNAIRASERLESQSPLPDIDRVCLQNPYIKALNVSLADTVAKMDSWSLEKHLAMIPQNKDNFLHTHARFFPFQPFTHCRSDKIACIGGSCRADASKIVCGLDVLNENKMQKEPKHELRSSTVQEEKTQERSSSPACVVYSIGGNNMWSFEMDLLGRTPCDVHTFDCTGPITRFRKPDNPRLHFHHVCLGTQHEDKAVKCVGKSKCGETWTMLEMQQKLGHSRIDLLKMDIEGFEWPIFESWPLLNDTAASEGMLLPMQVLVEIHYHQNFAALHPPGDPKNIVHLQSRFLKMGYVVVMRDDNQRCLHCSELTLIRIRCPGGGVYAEL